MRLAEKNESMRNGVVDEPHQQEFAPAFCKRLVDAVAPEKIEMQGESCEAQAHEHEGERRHMGNCHAGEEKGPAPDEAE